MKKNTMKHINAEEARKIDGGRRIYKCPWCSRKSSNFWSVYGHAIWHGAKRGLFKVPMWMIRTGFGF